MEDELIKLWQSEENHVQLKFEKSRLILETQASLDSFDRHIKYRDLREQIASAIAIPVFGFYIYFVPAVLSKIVSAFIVIWVVFMLVRLRSVQKKKPIAYHLSYWDFIQLTKAYMESQKKLNDTSLYWAIVPVISLSLLFVFGFYWEGIIQDGKSLVAVIVFILICGIGLYFLNRWMTKRIYTSRLDKINELINTLDEENKESIGLQ